MILVLGFLCGIVGFSRETETELVNYIYIELTHVVMEVKNSLNLPSTNWKTRKANSVIQLEPKDSRIGRGVGEFIV